ncbi:hypothetical protein B0H10DRAFT_2342839 [Mycena sp. CBHHK59/15]|nr:hypothetical protein B0H10DRAFT_2342839 [Mycena sp. CBHHK59/15]
MRTLSRVDEQERAQLQRDKELRAADRVEKRQAKHAAENPNPQPPKRRGRPPKARVPLETTSANTISSLATPGRPVIPQTPMARAPTCHPSPHRLQFPETKAPKKADQENIPPPIELADSDDEIERSADGKVRYWKPSEKTRVFTFILGLDTEGERRFNQHKTNPGRVYKRVRRFHAMLLRSNSRVTVPRLKSMFEHALKAFGWMRAFDGFTGNGSGDADSDDPTAILKSKLSAARKAGLPIGGLSPAKILEWEKNGWSDLFNNRFGTSAKVSRAAVRNSASPISDHDNDSGDDSDIYIHPELRKPAPRVQQTPAATVSEPKHTPSSNFRKQVTHSFGNLGEIMKMKMVSEEKKASVLESRLNLDREKLEMDKTKGKVEMAHTVLSTPGASDEVKEAANAWLLTVFSM